MNDYIKPYDYVKSIYDKKQKLDTEQYQPFLINRFLSLQKSDVLVANYMNMYSEIPKESQYEFYMAVIGKGGRKFAKWHKEIPLSKKELDIQKYYECSNEKAREYALILTKEDIKKIRKIINKGGRRK